MPDSQWVPPPHHTSDNYEQEWAGGNPPEPGMRKERDETSTTDRDPHTGTRTESRIVTYSDVIRVVDTVEPVAETCDRCGGGHTHTTSGSLHFDMSLEEHVPPEHFGDRTGDLIVWIFNGREVRRSQLTMIAPNGVRLPPLIQWEERNVDHRSTVIDSYGWSWYPCFVPGGGRILTSTNSMWMKVTEALITAAIVTHPSKHKIMIATLRPIIAEGIRVKNPTVTVESGSMGNFLVLADVNNDEVGKMSFTVSETMVKGLKWQPATIEFPGSSGAFATFGSQRTKIFEQAEDGKANDLHIRFEEPVTVFTNPDTGNAGPFQNISGNGTSQINLSNAANNIPRGENVKLTFRSQNTTFPKITQWQWTKDGLNLGSPQVETE